MDVAKTIAVIATSVLVLIGAGLLISRSSGNIFLAQLFFASLLVIAAMLVWYVVTQDTPIAWLVSTFYFSLLLVFVLVVYFNAASGILILVASVLIGMVGLAISSLSVENSRVEKEVWHEIRTETLVPPEEPVDTTVKVIPYGTQTNIEKEEEKNILGKFVASRIGKKFHLPDCGWTQKIQNENRIWLKDKQAALEHGLEPCYCVK